jgi:hypothetical protein
LEAKRKLELGIPLPGDGLDSDKTLADQALVKQFLSRAGFIKYRMLKLISK